MKLYAQQGYGTGERIVTGLQQGVIDGAIVSPKDCSLERVNGLFSMMENDFPSAHRLFDPQFYTSILALESASIGKLSGDDYPYLQSRRRGQLESESMIVRDLQTCLEFQKSVNVTSAIAPNIVIRQSFNSIEAVIAKNFIRHSANIWGELGGETPLYATLIVDAEALQDRHELVNFLTDITLLENPPAGFYLAVNHPTTAILPELIDQRTLAGWMLLNHSLSLNGFEVINGYSDMLSPFLAAAGATAGATGWWSNLKVFSMSRFQVSSGGGSRPIARYFSKALLNSIRFDEFDRIRRGYPVVTNGLPADRYFSDVNGSQPDSQVEEVIQSWEAIGSYWATGIPELSECRDWVSEARNLYGQLNASPGINLPARSNDYHLDSLEDGLDLFGELAEIEF